MSYILDALKKSEQERGHGNIPDVQTVHSSGLNYHKQKKAYWPYFLITAVLLNFAAITYFIADKDAPETEISSTEKMAPTIEDNTSEASLTTAIDKNSESIKVENKPLAQQTKPTIKAIEKPVAEVTQAVEKAPTKKPQETVEQPASHTGDNIIDFNELPESIKQGLPGIIISAHVYSSNPAQRSIVINNNFMEEGEYLIDDLVLYEITPEGAIFSYQGYLFNYGAVSSWQ